MATLGDMRTRIANELQIDATTYATEIDDAITSSIALYNDEDFYFLEATPTNVLLTATAAYDLSTILPDRSNIRAVTLQYNRDIQTMNFRTVGEFAGLQSGFTGDPCYWTVNAGQLLVEPTPVRTFTAVVWHTDSNTLLSMSACATSVWTNEAEEIIRLCAKVDLLTNRIRDFDAANIIQGRLQMVVQNMHQKTVVRRSARRLRPHL